MIAVVFCATRLAIGQNTSENVALHKGDYTYLYDTQADTTIVNRFLEDLKHSDFIALLSENIEDHFTRALEITEEFTDESYRIRILNKQSEYKLSIGEYDSAFALANKVIREAESLDVPTAFIDSNYRLSVILRRRGDFIEAMNHIQKGLDKAKEIDSKFWIVNGYGKMSAINQRLNRRHEALENLLTAQKEAEELGNLAELAMIKVRIGRMYLDLRELDKALEYRTAALELAEQSGDSLMIATAKHRLGDCYRELNQPDKALTLYKEAAEYRKDHTPRDRYAQVLSSIGTVYYERGLYEEAQEYYNRALPNFKVMNHNAMVFDVYTDMGKVYMHMDNPRAARNVYEEASKYIDSPHRYSLYAGLYQQLSQLEATEQNYKEALRYQKLHKAYYDSMQFDKQNKLSAYNEARFEFKLEEEKQQAVFNAQLSAKEQQIAYRNYLIGGFIVFTAIIIVLLILLYRSKAKQKEALNIIREKNRSLEELDEIKNNFFTILAHDLRNPFGPILQLSEMLHQYSKENDFSDLEEMTSLLEQSANRFKNLLESTLEWGRLQMDGVKVAKEPLNLSEEVERILSFSESSAQMKEIRILNKVEKDIGIYTDKDLFQAVLNNLVNNAIKFTDSGGKITISADIIDQNFVEVSVTDDGIGMSKEKLNSIFTPGKHMSEEGTEGEKGTGFGLINSKKMVELNGGQMSIESTEGEGTVVRFTVELSQ